MVIFDKKIKTKSDQNTPKKNHIASRHANSQI